MVTKKAGTAINIPDVLAKWLTSVTRTALFMQVLVDRISNAHGRGLRNSYVRNLGGAAITGARTAGITNTAPRFEPTVTPRRAGSPPSISPPELIIVIAGSQTRSQWERAIQCGFPALVVDITSMASQGTLALTVRFYGRKDPYYEFSNFYKSPITLDGGSWSTVEHYFQSRKFVGSLKNETEVGNAGSAMQAAKMGRDRKRPLRKDWEAVKDKVMLDGVLAKCKATRHFAKHRRSENCGAY